MSSIDLTTQTVRSRSSSPRNPKAARKETRAGGIEVQRFFTKPGVDVYDTCEWEMRNAGITNERGNVVGLMPHPEHAVEALTGPSVDGLRFFTSVINQLVDA